MKTNSKKIAPLSLPKKKKKSASFILGTSEEDNTFSTPNEQIVSDCKPSSPQANTSTMSNLTLDYLLSNYSQNKLTFEQLFNSKKSSTSYLEDMYIKYSKAIHKYFTKYKDNMKLQGSRKFENLPVELFLEEIEKYRNNVIREIKQNNFAYRQLGKDNAYDEQFELTPIPNKSRLLMETKKEKRDFSNAERKAVVMRTVEYTHTLRTKEGRERYRQDLAKERAQILYIMKRSIDRIQDWYLTQKENQKTKKYSNFRVNNFITTIGKLYNRMKVHKTFRKFYSNLKKFYSSQNTKSVAKMWKRDCKVEKTNQVNFCNKDNLKKSSKSMLSIDKSEDYEVINQPKPKVYEKKKNANLFIKSSYEPKMKVLKVNKRVENFELINKKLPPKFRMQRVNDVGVEVNKVKGLIRKDLNDGLIFATKKNYNTQRELRKLNILQTKIKKSQKISKILSLRQVNRFKNMALIRERNCGFVLLKAFYHWRNQIKYINLRESFSENDIFQKARNYDILVSKLNKINCLINKDFLTRLSKTYNNHGLSKNSLLMSKDIFESPIPNDKFEKKIDTKNFEFCKKMLVICKKGTFYNLLNNYLQQHGIHLTRKELENFMKRQKENTKNANKSGFGILNENISTLPAEDTSILGQAKKFAKTIDTSGNQREIIHGLNENNEDEPISPTKNILREDNNFITFSKNTIPNDFNDASDNSRKENQNNDNIGSRNSNLNIFGQSTNENIENIENKKSNSNIAAKGSNSTAFNSHLKVSGSNLESKEIAGNKNRNHLGIGNSSDQDQQGKKNSNEFAEGKTNYYDKNIRNDKDRLNKADSQNESESSSIIDNGYSSEYSNSEDRNSLKVKALNTGQRNNNDEGSIRVKAVNTGQRNSNDENNIKAIKVGKSDSLQLGNPSTLATRISDSNRNKINTTSQSQSLCDKNNSFFNKVSKKNSAQRDSRSNEVTHNLFGGKERQTNYISGSRNMNEATETSKAEDYIPEDLQNAYNLLYRSSRSQQKKNKLILREQFDDYDF